MRAVTLAAAVAVTALAALVALGCGLAFLFELQGFGGPRDEGPRTLVLAAYAAGLAGAAAVAAATWWLALRRPRRGRPRARATPAPPRP